MASIGTSLTAITIIIGALIWVIGYVNDAKAEIKHEMQQVEVRVTEVIRMHTLSNYHVGTPSFVRDQVNDALAPIKDSLARINNKLDRMD